MGRRKSQLIGMLFDANTIAVVRVKALCRKYPSVRADIPHSITNQISGTKAEKVEWVGITSTDVHYYCTPNNSNFDYDYSY